MLELPSGSDFIWIGITLSLTGLVIVLAVLWGAPWSVTWKFRLLLLYVAFVALAILLSR